MKFTVILLITLCVSTWAVKVKKTDDPKDKREAALGYPSSSHSFQAPSYGHGDASAISIGAGYSVGGAKPSFSYGAPESAGLQLSSDDLQSNGHATFQLAPITLQPSQSYGSADLSELMSQLTHGLQTGAISLSPYQSAGQSAHGGQEFSFPQLSSYGSQNLQQYSVSEQPISSVPHYAAGTKGLGSYSTGPVLFNPDAHASQASLFYSAPSSGHSFADAGALSLGDSGHSYAGLSSGGSGHSLGASGLSLGGSSGHSLGGHGLSLGSSGHSLGSSGHSLGSSGLSLGGSGHSLKGPRPSLGGSGHSLGGSYKSFGGGYAPPSKTSFKPSAFIGSSGDSIHGLSSSSGSYGTPSFGSQSFSGGHGLSFASGGHGASFGGSSGGFGDSSKLYLPPKSGGFGSSDSVASFATSGHLSSSPPATTYGSPSSSYGHANSIHAASSQSPQYYVMATKYASPSFGEGSSSYRGPSSSHSSLSSGSKYSFGGHSSPSSRYASPKDSHGAHSETSYNTIKYSEELKPRMMH